MSWGRVSAFPLPPLAQAAPPPGRFPPAESWNPFNPETNVDTPPNDTPNDALTSDSAGGDAGPNVGDTNNGDNTGDTGGGDTGGDTGGDNSTGDPTALTGAALVATLDKDGLEEFARVEFKRELDKRKRLDTLRAEVLALVNGETQRTEAVQAAAEADASRERTPLKCRSKTTGLEWDWHPLYAKNGDLEVTEWAD